MNDTAPQRVELAQLLDSYDGFLLDAYGVLVDGTSALPGAATLLETLDERGKPYRVVSNDASRLAETVAARFARLGLEVLPAEIVTSGHLLAPYFRDHDLAGANCLVLGTADSRAFVEQAGGIIADIDPRGDYDAFIVCDDDGYPFIESVNATLSALFRAFDAGRTPQLILPNPDLVFPVAKAEFGFTSGSIAALLEAALAQRFPALRPRFTPLGKPHRPIFDFAAEQLGQRRLLMIGDQLETDIAGARAAGLDTLLVESGISRWRPGCEVIPTYVLAELAEV